MTFTCHLSHARIQEVSSGGGGGGVQVNLTKKALTTSAYFTEVKMVNFKEN